MKTFRINETAWYGYRANLNIIATSVLTLGVLIGQTDDRDCHVYDILPIAPFQPEKASDEFTEYLDDVDGSGCDFGRWLSEMLVNLKLMQISGMKLIGLTVSSVLKNFDICNEKFLAYLESAACYMSSPSEMNILVVDPATRTINQATTIDLENRKAQSNEFILEHEMEHKVLVKTQLSLSRVAVVPYTSELTDSEIVAEQISTYASKITSFLAIHAGVILSSSQSLESIEGLNKYLDEVQLELFSNESFATMDNTKDDSETRKIIIDGSFELRCYVSLKSTVAEILSYLAKDFVESITTRIELAAYENQSVDSNSAKLKKHRTRGFNLSRRAFMRLQAHPYLLYQDYIGTSEVVKDSRKRISKLTGINAEIIGDFETSQLGLLGKPSQKKLIDLQEVVVDKKLIRKIAGMQMGEFSQLKLLTGDMVKDPADFMKKFALMMMAFISLLAVRAIMLDMNVDTI